MKRERRDYVAPDLTRYGTVEEITRAVGGLPFVAGLSVPGLSPDIIETEIVELELTGGGS